MAAGKGSDVAIFLGDGGAPEVFSKLGTFRVNEMTLDGDEVNITDKNSAAWRELLAGGGERTVTLTGSGIFTDTADEETLRSQAFAQSIDNYEFHFSDASKIAGAFQVRPYSRSGDHNDAEQFSATFHSSGAIAFTA